MNNNLLRTVHPATAVTLGSVPIALPGQTVSGATGLATHPYCDYADSLPLLRTPESGNLRELATIDPATGVAASLGITDHFFACHGL